MDINPNQPADMTPPADPDGKSTSGDANMMDPGMGGRSATDEVPVGTEGAEPGMDYTGDVDVGGVPAQAPANTPAK